jgi:N-acetylneuraminic acid mutarotase
MKKIIPLGPCKAGALVLILTLGLAAVCSAAEDTWTYKADMHTARTFVSGCVVDEKIYVIGGAPSSSSVTSTVEMYDPTTDTWTRLANMPSARCAHATCAFDGKIYVFGGTSPNMWSTAKKNIYVYDPQTDTWTQKADMPYANAFCGIAVVEGTIYLIGGMLIESSPPVSTIMAYDPITESWTQKADMPTARGSLSACVMDGKIYAIGGSTEDWRVFSYEHVEVYDPSTDTWTRKSDMPTQRWGLGTCVVDGKIHAIGGGLGSDPITANEVYVPITDTWTTKSPMQQKRCGLYAGSVGDKIYAIGGSVPPMLSTVEEYDTGLGVPSPDFEEMRPIADAGSSRYAGVDAVILDGTGSYDPDSSGPLFYAWRQISGPSVVIADANVATPVISGFIQTDEIQECEFELLVSDGELTSLPDSVKIIIVPDFGTSMLRLENTSFDKDKPTVIYFGGGDCTNGYSGQPWNGGLAWTNKANIIGFPSGYMPDSGSTGQTYYKYGDMIIAYLSAVVPDYKQPIQTIGWSTGAMPAIDVGIHMNLVYRDPRYAVNHVTHLDGNPACRDANQSMVVYLDAVESFLTSSVDGEQCWMEHYYGTAAYAYEPMPRSDILWVRTGLAHNEVRDWYRNSLAGSDMSKFNSGVVGGAYWSVLGPGKNLQLAAEPGVYYFQWNGSAQTGAMVLLNQSDYPGRLPEPVTLLNWHDPRFPDDDPNGIVLTCEESENAVGYQLLSGSDPYNVADYNIVAENNVTSEVTMGMLPTSDKWWTVKVRDAYGSTIYADPIRVGLPVGVIAYWKLDEAEGSFARDIAGDSHGVLHGQPQWQPEGGMKAGALQLDGIDDYVSTDFVIDPAEGPFSIFAWIKGGVPGQGIISQADGNGTGETWLGTEAIAGRLMTGLVPPQAGRTIPQPLVAESVITDDQWHHVGFVWDGSYRNLYLDGTEVAKDVNALATLESATGGIYIGVGKNLDEGTFFSGMIDDVRIYNVALTPDEITALAQ